MKFYEKARDIPVGKVKIKNRGWKVLTLTEKEFPSRAHSRAGDAKYARLAPFNGVFQSFQLPHLFLPFFFCNRMTQLQLSDNF